MDKLNAEVTELAKLAGYAAPECAGRMHRLVELLTRSAQIKCLSTLPYMDERIKSLNLRSPDTGVHDIYMLAITDCMAAIGVLLQEDE